MKWEKKRYRELQRSLHNNNKLTFTLSEKRFANMFQWSLFSFFHSILITNEIIVRFQCYLDDKSKVT